MSTEELQRHQLQDRPLNAEVLQARGSLGAGLDGLRREGGGGATGGAGLPSWLESLRRPVGEDRVNGSGDEVCALKVDSEST